ncbi:PIN domain-containing protein [Geoalkalibacter sp.]|uniref:PIN domain-containing protein n=1 Tax=Geoalkalibacter sp. TaxID=3041440 RepID=UPI00272E18E1|nr:PIN domain-containing protein [Geoalkalibacter sp.]
MSAEILPDTNVILRYLLGDVPDQFTKAEAFFEKVRTGAERALLLESVVVECVYVLTRYYQVPKERVVATLTELLQYKGITNSDKDTLVAGLRLYGNNALDVVDCLLLAQAHATGRRGFSFDKKLKRQALNPDARTP